MRKKNILVIEHDQHDWNRTKARLDNFNINKYYEFTTIIEDLDGCINAIEKLNLTIYDAIFLDVYFWSEKTDIEEESKKDDSYILLDKIRKRAPWMPVIAFTQHLDQGKLTYEISKRHYDAIVPKKLIKKNTKFCVELFDEIVDNSITNRQSYANCCEYLIDYVEKKEICDTNKFNIEMDDETQEFFYKYFNNEKKLKKYFGFIFPYHREVIIKKISDGFSGNQAFEVTAKSKETRFGTISFWFLKSGNKINELSDEIKAYREIQSSGIHHQYFPPILHNGVIAENIIGSIVYQLEKDSNTLYKSIENTKNDDYEKIINKIFKIIKGIQGETANEYGLVKNHFINQKKLEDLYKKIEITNKLPNYIKDNSNIQKFINIKLRYRKSLIHGDLHTRNIMVNKNQKIYLIDFAKADYKPVVYDPIKLELDILNKIYTDKVIGNQVVFELINNLDLNNPLDMEHGFYVRAIRKCFLLEINQEITESEWLVGNVVLSLKFASYDNIKTELKRKFINRAKMAMEKLIEANGTSK